MAFPSSYTRYQAVTNNTTTTTDSSTDYNSDTLYSTAYHGAGATKTITPTRQPLGSRLLSTFSSAQPAAAAAALSRQGSVLHSRAKSLAAFVPRLSTSNGATSPERTQQRHPVFGDLFNGESAPVRLGIPPSSPTKEESEFIMDYKPSLTERPTGPRRKSTAPTQGSTTITITTTTIPSSKPTWFTRRPTLPATPSATNPPTDKLLTLNINTALFPHGPADPLSPHAYNDLLLTATTLLSRLQTAYAEKVSYISSIQPEIDAQREEVEEAETRAQHLKMQLEDMSRQAQEQERAMREMALQLAGEKMKVQELREMAQNSIKLVRRSTDELADEVTPRRIKRASGSSAGNASDSGFESDLEYADSVTSAGAETPLTPPPTMTLTLTPAYDGHDWAATAVQPSTHYSRGSTASGCSRQAWNRHGGNASGSEARVGGQVAAWATVEQLRGENVQLRRQVDEMEGTLQGCIDLVSGGLKA
ncbi:hypothetical protein BAUCODRAFT_122128 [Baudoinia panamericana UAMH 10762]|uniref:Uncharacterized protein n=1 Tax=Baudoinia panamericana (strain UAMH 10762) TaxID=717646 RepID=M2NFD6_BAUPA|nr:uncharacterized protein BAUCODRAFT_122128 [Baudoinia panamericana UAMH 10762]EMC97700.1 hypothetical protein BAUCODRAFT_122128 [Baudoinia panamericana UAMH 10762]